MKKEISTVKDLMENEELNQFVTEDLEDFDEDTPVSYEVWTIGYDKDETITDSDMFVAEFKDPDEAIAYTKNLTLADIVHKATEDPVGVVDYEEIERISIEVETVVNDPDDEAGGTMNIGTIYKRELWLDGEYGSKEDIENPDPTVQLKESDYTLLEDGTLKVSCKLLRDFNKNDFVTFNFVAENDDVSILTYKIISKVIYEDGDYYHCEFEY